jgi:hypothetical protein
VASPVMHTQVSHRRILTSDVQCHDPTRLSRRPVSLLGTISRVWSVDATIYRSCKHWHRHAPDTWEAQHEPSRVTEAIGDDVINATPGRQ